MINRFWNWSKQQYRGSLHLPISIGIFLYLLLGGYCLHGETGNNTPADVALGTISTNGTENEVLIDLVRSSLKIEVERAGYRVVSIEAGQGGSPTELSEMYGTPAIIVCYVSGRGEDISLELVLNFVDDPVFVARTVHEGRIDLGFDSMIREAVSDILEQVLEYAPKLVQSEPVVSEPQVEEVGDVSAEPTEEQTPESVLMQSEASDTKIAFRPFRISAGAAPFVAVGKVNYYFSLGLLASLRGGYTFQTRIGDIETGLFLGVHYFTALGLETSSSNILIPLGASVRYGTGIGRRLQVFVSVTGGPALFFLTPTEGDQLFKVTGYAGAGGGGSFLFSDRLGFTVEIDYMLFFEQYYPIMGVVPSIYFDVRF